jgi:cyclopropane fatty-acyl-phospholipid synthase-like methyltransferase
MTRGPEDFASSYEGRAPWDIGEPQPVLLGAAARITGSVLDAGCGTGENALYLASLGRKVTGVDFVAEAIRRAKQKATDRGLAVTFLVMNALHLKELPELFDNAIDSGLFHVFADDERRQYVAGLASVIKPSGRLFMLCFSDEEAGTQGPRRISRADLEAAFADGWRLESVEPVRFTIRDDAADLNFSPGGPKAWFVVAERR